MKTYRKEFWFNLPTRVGFVNLTPDAEQCVVASTVQEELLLVNAMHITANVFINDDGPARTLPAKANDIGSVLPASTDSSERRSRAQADNR